ncbi:MAG: PilZ domain-containing protein [Nitrospirae bacterium]|nr:PilZ domain-containing protein [Nitrospirota bacterium]
MAGYDRERADDRLSVQMAARIHCYGERFIGTVVNLGAGGAFVRAGRTLPMQVRCDLVVIVGDGGDPEHLLVTGTVVHLADGGMGIKFDTLAPGTLARLLGILSSGGTNLKRRPVGSGG